jgi:hypothetical protein
MNAVYRSSFITKIAMKNPIKYSAKSINIFLSLESIISYARNSGRI